MKKIFLCTLLAPLISFAQPTTFPVNGVDDNRQEVYAFTNATIHVSFDKTIENGTLLIRKGKVEAVGSKVSIEQGTVVYDLGGKHIYPSFVELFSNYGVPEPKPIGPAPEQKPQMTSHHPNANAWNEALKPEFSAYQNFKPDAKAAKNLRNAGIGVVLCHRYDGIARGTGTLAFAGDEEPHLMIAQREASTHFSFKKGTSTQDYPSSLMGAIALLRQTYYDAQWYAKHGNKEETNVSLQRWNTNIKLPAIFDVRDRLEAMRADKIGDEFSVQYIIKGTGDEYLRVEELKASKAPFIIPLKFPQALDVEDPNDALMVSLTDLWHWEMASSNAARLSKSGIPFAFTTEGLEKKEDVFKLLRKVVKTGLPKQEALKALTYFPAQLLGAEGEYGHLAKGAFANFFITDNDFLEKEAVIFQHWVKGKMYSIQPIDKPDTRGLYILKIGEKSYSLLVEGEKPEAPKFMLKEDSVVVKHTISGNAISLIFNPEKGKMQNSYRLNGIIDGAKMMGTGEYPTGNRFNWTAEKLQPFTPKVENDVPKSDDPQPLQSIHYPFQSYGNLELPKQQTYLVKNATVWTNESEGILLNADVWVEKGKIVEIGRYLDAKIGTVVVDGTGKHLTAGIIDEHSHIAISRGVNEGTQSSSAEVRIGDVVNSEDVNIYRQLAGGVTACQLLHGSANAIGGQSALVKLKWGYSPEAMKIEGAKGYIKFALGENVKQSNWGDHNTTRFPQSRMGVEQVYENYFTKAQEYAKKHDRHDLELECLGEILDKERFITCHSYVQSEINMLMKVADNFGFKINTFTHILEGYKVADKMKAHGVGASSFADWWAYKMEVDEAIPYNAYLLNKMGVCTAINSDDAEMARRLNQETAKTVKYGGVSEENAWKMVTLNPAKLLRLDHRMGSIKVGKDADLVLWNDNPLSQYASAEKTWVDGILFYDKVEDFKKRDFIRKERARLIQKLIDEKSTGAETSKPVEKHHHHYHCDDVEDELQD